MIRFTDHTTTQTVTTTVRGFTAPMMGVGIRPC
jgi:hypothetical protein